MPVYYVWYDLVVQMVKIYIMQRPEGQSEVESSTIVYKAL